MDDVEALLAKAEHYRAMARGLVDTRARNALLELAGEYERQATLIANRTAKPSR